MHDIADKFRRGPRRRRTYIHKPPDLPVKLDGPEVRLLDNKKRDGSDKARPDGKEDVT